MDKNGNNGNHRLAVRGNTSRLLYQPKTVWVVESGTVAVFSVRVREGQATGRRRYLCTCKAEELLFGSDPAKNDQQRTFLVVGLGDAVVQEVPLHDLLRTCDLSGKDLARRIDDWVRKLADVIAEDAPLAHAERTEKTGEVQLGNGQTLRPPLKTVRWVEVVQGRVQVINATHMTLDSTMGVVPLSDDLWLTAKENSSLRVQPMVDVNSLDQGDEAIARLHQFCFAHLQLREERELTSEAKRLEERQRLEERDTSDALRGLTDTLRPESVTFQENTDLLTALAAIGRTLGVSFSPPANSEDMRRVADPMKAIARASRIRTRDVVLTNHWWKHDCGPLLGYTRGQNPVALMPVRRLFGCVQHYEIFDPQTQTTRRVNRKSNESLSTEAVSFVCPLPATKTASLRALAKFGLAQYRVEAVYILVLSILVAVLGMLTPAATRLIIDEAIPDANPRLLLEWGLALFAVAVGTVALKYSQGMFLLRLRTGAVARLQTAVMDRMLRLASRFFRQFSSGDLMNRSMMVTEVSQEISSTAMNGILAGLMALLNLALCYYYSSKLAWLAIATALIVALTSLPLSFLIRNRALQLEQLSGKLFGFAVQLVNGVSKLRVAGAEQRAFNNWARRYAKQLELVNSIQQIQDWSRMINMSIRTASLTALFFFATILLSGGSSPATELPGALLTMGTFLAFHSAFGTFIGGAVGVSNTAVDVMDSWAKRKLIEPILTEAPEIDTNKVDPGRLRGEVTVEESVFRYREDGPLVLDGVSVHANPGDFIALVGPSGCGKSTMFKLLLGLEAPESGSVFYDGQDLAGLDMPAVRRQIGVVLQSSYITAGSIFDGIASGNRVSLEEVWEAARDAGFGKDVEEMPMGMHTVLPEGGMTLSGGQKQRLLIARALVLNPKILLFDEATSALDNRTQEIVSQSVQRRNVTRIVVAHRLSTIKDADRIYVLDRGHVVQAGTFVELAEQEGLFQRMVARQLT